MVQDAYNLLANDFTVRHWFFNAWSDAEAGFLPLSGRGANPFNHDIVFIYTGRWGVDVFDYVAMLRGANSYWNLYSDTISFLPKAFEGTVSLGNKQLSLTMTLMHELNNWASEWGGYDNHDPIRGSYTAEGVAGAAFFGTRS